MIQCEILEAIVVSTMMPQNRSTAAIAW